MDKRIKDIFNDVCSSLTIDEKLCKKIERKVTEFVTRNPDHSAFFGGSLTGPYEVKFTTADRLDWFDDILGVQEEELAPRCNEIINSTTYKVAGDVFNLSCVWLSHAIWNNGKLSEKRKIEAMIAIWNYAQFRFLTSRLQRHWPYLCSKDVAEATLAQMSNKYDIKAKGSWLKLIESRSEAITDKKTSIHWRTIDKMDIDVYYKGGKSEGVAYLLTDTQGRIKAILKNIYGLQKMIQEENSIRIVATGGTYLETDGSAAIKDKEKSLETYRNYLTTIISDKNSFIKLDIVGLIERSNKTMSPQMFRQTLSWISDNYNRTTETKTNLDDIINRVMTHCISYLSNNRDTMKNKSDVAGLVNRLKGIYGSSRSTDELLLGIREDIEKVVTMATKVKNNQSVSACRTGVMLYIVMRAFTMQYYS